MRTIVITPPEPIVTFDDAASELQLGSDQSQKTFVEGLIAAVTAHIDGPDGWLGRSLGPQTLEARFSARRCTHYGVRLPCGPVTDLVSIQYLDASDQLVDGNLADVELLGDELAPTGTVFPWAQGSWRREAVRVRYDAGSPANVIAIAKAAILLMVADLFRNRGEALINQTSVKVAMTPTVENLLNPLRLFF